MNCVGCLAELGDEIIDVTRVGKNPATTINCCDECQPIIVGLVEVIGSSVQKMEVVRRFVTAILTRREARERRYDSN